MDLFLNILYIILGLGLLTKGADWFVSGSVRISLRLGISAAIVGATIVAFGTSAPELLTGVMAATRGEVELALGNIVGSNIANICLALGLTGLIRPIRCDVSILRWDGPFFVIAALGLVAFAWVGSDAEYGSSVTKVLDSWEGFALLGIFGLFMFSSVIRGLRSRKSEIAEEVIQELTEIQKHHWIKDLLVFLVGLVSLVGGSWVLVEGASNLAKDPFGIDPFIVGATIVAIGTSLPEIMTSLIAARKGNADLAIANVTGSNIQNIILCLAAAAVFASTGFIPVHPEIAGFDLWVLLGLTFLLVIFMAWGKSIAKGRATLLVLIYIAYTAYIIVRGKLAF